MKIEIISLFLIFFSVITITLGIIKLHTYPGKIAVARNHPSPRGPNAWSYFSPQRTYFSFG